MTRPVVGVLIATALVVAVAVAVSQRRLQAAFEEVRHEDQAQLERVEAMARADSLLRELGDADAAERQAARGELMQTVAALRLELPAAADPRRVELERLAALVDADPARHRAEAQAAVERFLAVAARAQKQAAGRADELQAAALLTQQLALGAAVALALLLGLGLSLKLTRETARLAAAAERIARGNLEAPVPPAAGALAELAPAVKRTAAALARREREVEALATVAALPASEPDRLLAEVRAAVAAVLDVRALTLVAVDGAEVRRLGSSQAERPGERYPYAGSAVALALGRGEPVAFDVDRGAHPEDAAARAAGARAYAVVPLPEGALVVDLGLSALAVAQMRFLRLLARLLTDATATARADELAPKRAKNGRAGSI